MGYGSHVRLCDEQNGVNYYFNTSNTNQLQNSTSYIFHKLSKYCKQIKKVINKIIKKWAITERTTERP